MHICVLVQGLMMHGQTYQQNKKTAQEYHLDSNFGQPAFY